MTEVAKISPPSVIPIKTLESTDNLIIESGGVTRRAPASVVVPGWFGGLDGQDATVAFQAAIDALGPNGGVVNVPKGTFYLSIANSISTYACLVIPKNITIRGAGKDITIIQRLPAERGTNGVLMVNKNWDTTGEYGADGNICIEHLNITDGATTPARALGDLIGFGNGDGLIVQYCHFGNHDQHAVDVCKSRNVTIRYNSSENQVSASASATYQIDAGLIWGIAASATPDSYNVLVHDNLILDSRAGKIIHFHGANQSSNVRILRNTIHGENLPDGGDAIGADSDCGFDGVWIEDNVIYMANIDARAINLPIADDGGGNLKDVFIRRNYVEGQFRIGVYVGDDGPAETTHILTGPVHISENTFVVDATPALTVSGGVRVVSAALLETVIMDRNEVRISCAAQADAIRVIEDISNANFFARGNRIVREDSGAITGTTDAIYSSWVFQFDNTIHKHWDVSSNFIDFDGCDHHIYTSDPGDVSAVTDFSGTISGNRMLGAPGTANIFEALPLSDGTNNLQFVDFTGKGAAAGDPFMRSISTGQHITDLPLTGTKKSDTSDDRGGYTTLKILYSPLGTNFGSDAENIQPVYVSSTQAVGITIKDVDHAAGIFDLVTGGHGVSMVINDATFQPVIRTSGYIKVLCGI